MFVIFVASIILQLVDPLNYSVFRDVSSLHHRTVKGANKCTIGAE